MRRRPAVRLAVLAAYLMSVFRSTPIPIRGRAICCAASLDLIPFKEEVRGSNPLRATDRELSAKSAEDLRAALTVGEALRFLGAYIG